MRRYRPASLILILLFAYLLLSPETALASAREGLLLWYRSIVPALFPFMVLCSLAIRMQVPDSLLALLARPLHALFGCSRYGSFAVLTGFLCGFPMGAKITSELEAQHLISGREAAFLYGFVNNLSPVFLISFLASDQMHRPDRRGTFLFAILGASVLYGILTSVPYRRAESARNSSGKGSGAAPHRSAVHAGIPPENAPCFSFSLLDDCTADAAENTVRLGAYIMLFSILTGAAKQGLPTEYPAFLLLTASIEVTNGVQLLAASALSFPLKFILINALCAFGGFSALAQSVSIAKMDRPQIRAYIKSRVCNTLLCALLSAGILLSGGYFHI